MVTGGWIPDTKRGFTILDRYRWDSLHLDSTEVFQDNEWRTVTGKLPAAVNKPPAQPSFLTGLRAVTVSNRILLFGNTHHIDYLIFIYKIFR